MARAAARAGVRVVVLTDHGDATRPADPPAYVDGVLVLDAVEISTWGGHYVALGAAPAPYPLGGEPRAAVEDVGRLGGVGLVAHPGSSRPACAGASWDAPVDGLEWLNADSEWRDQPGTAVANGAGVSLAPGRGAGQPGRSAGLRARAMGST